MPAAGLPAQPPVRLETAHRPWPGLGRPRRTGLTTGDRPFPCRGGPAGPKSRLSPVGRARPATVSTPGRRRPMGVLRRQLDGYTVVRLTLSKLGCGAAASTAPATGWGTDGTTEMVAGPSGSRPCSCRRRTCSVTSKLTSWPPWS